MLVGCVGIACVDVILHVHEYPVEDTEVRATGMREARGGNATNSLVVMAQLGARPVWFGSTIDPAASADAALICRDLAESRVDYRAVRLHPRGQVPKSWIAASGATGSRTIIHLRELEELRAEEFWEGMLRVWGDAGDRSGERARQVVAATTSALDAEGYGAAGEDVCGWWQRRGEAVQERIRREVGGEALAVAQRALSRFAWLHFEGRAVEETARMLVSVLALRGPRDAASSPPAAPPAEFVGAAGELEAARVARVRLLSPTVSVEAEKSRRGLAALLPLCDLCVCSRDFCASLAPPPLRPETAAASVLPLVVPGTVVVLPWGAAGAGAYWQLSAGTEPGALFVDAVAPPGGAVVDSVGAGDTFQAALVVALSAGWPLASAMRCAVRLAGTKVGQVGFAGVARRAGMEGLF